jgi:hypothetical protein
MIYGISLLIRMIIFETENLHYVIDAEMGANELLNP